MNSPYTPYAVDAILAAQTSVGMTLSALLLRKPIRPLAASWALFAAIWISIVWLAIPPFVSALGFVVPPERYLALLKFTAGLASMGMILTMRPLLITTGLTAQGVLFYMVDTVTQSEGELAAAHLAAFGLLIGVAWHDASSPAQPVRARVAGSFWLDDVILVVAGAVLGGIVATYVLHRYTNSGDEWGYTFQASVFAKGRAYAEPSRCSTAFTAFWVFEWSGKLFSQYTPGWAYFMTPFVAIRAAWMAGPFALGVLAAGVARLGRRAFATGGLSRRKPSHGEVRAAGFLSGATILLGSTMLINGASRYPHVFVAGCFAWALEALFVVVDEDADRAAQRGWGLVLGSAAALMLATRTADGGTLGIGIAVYFVIGLARRKVGWVSLATAAASFVFWGGLTLVILRLQLGKWFATGYSLSTTIYPWNQFRYGWPHASELKYPFPIATGSYCWWPCAPALGFAGLAALRGHARRIAFVFFLSCVPFLVFYMYLEMGRGYELGYGPRYQFPMVVPMAVGGGALLGELWAAAHRRFSAATSFARGGPIAIALAALALGVVRIAPLVYPHNYSDVMAHNRLQEALKESAVHDAVVFVGPGLNNTSPLDLTENLPLQLYPPGDVVIAMDVSPELTKCVRDMFPTRQHLRATPGPKIKFDPM